MTGAAYIARNIRTAIAASGLKQYVVAERAGFTPSDFNCIVCGRKIIRAEYIPILAEVLGITPNDLLRMPAQQPIDAD